MPPLASAACPVLESPGSLRTELPLPPAMRLAVAAHRRAIAAVMAGADPRLLVVVGPCSIHDPEAARDYARRLCVLADRHADRLLVAMRVYLEKPRTRLGWRGLVADPRLDGSRDLPAGLRLGRRLLLDVLGLGLPTACELLDPIVEPYLSDLVCWNALGARTTESQVHREMASGLPMAVGVKNGTDGDLGVAVDALHAIAAEHTILGIDEDGRAAVRRTPGNLEAHLVLRGGRDGPNHHPVAVARAARALAEAELPVRLMVDCSHGNSGGDHRWQATVAREVARQVAAGSTAIRGVMLESHLHAGRQALGDPATLRYGMSVTDACMGMETTAAVLGELAEAV